MKKILKVFLYLILTIFSLIIVLSVVAKLAENKIADEALDRLSEVIETPMEIDNINFNLLRGFPYATIELQGMWLGSPLVMGSDSSMLASDTLISINKVYLSVKSKPLLYGKYEVIKVEIEGADFYYNVDANGVTNFDFLIDTTQIEEEPDTTIQTPLDVLLNELSIKNISFIYSDSSLKVGAKLFIPEIKLNGSIKDDKYAGSVVGGLNFSECSYEGTNLNLMNKTALNFDLDYVGDSLSIRNFSIETDGAKLNTSGSVLLQDEIHTDIEFHASEIVFNELIKYAPKEILQEYGIHEFTGTMMLDATVKGIVSETNVPNVYLNIAFKNGSVITKDYPALKNISFSGNVSNGILANNKTTSANFKNFHFETGQSKFDFAFSVLDIDHPKYDVKSDMQINIDDFRYFISDTLLKDIGGKVNVSFATKGQLPDSIDDDFTDYVLDRTRLKLNFMNIDVNVDDTLLIQDFNAKFSYAPKRIKLNSFGVKVPSYNVDLKESSLDVIITGKTTDMKTLGIDVRSFKIQTGSNVVEGNATVYNIDKPEYTINTNIHLNLGELIPYVPDSIMNSMTGSFDANIHSVGKINLDSIDEQTMPLVFENSRFNFKATNIIIDMIDSTSDIENFSMDFAMNKGIINIDNVYGKYQGLEFWADSTEILNVYETIIQERRDKELIVQTKVKLGDITNSFLSPYMSTDDEISNSSESESDVEENSRSTEAAENNKAETSDTNADKNETTDAQATEITDNTNPDSDLESTSLLPDFAELGVPHFLVRGELSINKIEYEKNIIEDLSLKFRFADSLYVIDQFKLKMCGGDMNTSILFDARKWDKPKVDIKNIVNNFDIRQLLKDNDNFGDTTLTYEKVGGILSSNLDFRGFFIGDSMPTNKIRVKGHMKIIDGKIYDYAPLVELSTSIGGLKELDKMDFNTLNTDIFVYKDKVYVPKTDIVSSALDISVFAMQSFQDDYEYHLVLHLGDVLTGKSDKLMEKQAKQNKKDGGTVERNGINLVSMQIGDDKKNGFDNEKMKQNFKNKLNMQQGFLNLLFNPMLVNFSTDLDRDARNREILEKYGNEHKKED